MTLTEKLNFLQTNHFSEWLKVRQETENDISDKQFMFCLCGRLATGLHESHCRKFQHKVVSETVKKLSPLLTRLKNE